MYNYLLEQNSSVLNKESYGIFRRVIVPLIVIIVYGCIELLKKAVGNNEKALRVIPLIAATLGAVLG